MKAFPVSGMTQLGQQPIEAVYNTGMDLRDYFAAVALQGQLASNQGWGGNPVDRISECSYKLADAMMKARNAPT